MELQVLVIDHYDSFTYNLFQYLSELGAGVEVVRTNVSFDEIRKREPTHVVLSPGPGHPKDVAAFLMAIEHWGGHVPILGVCLGHQAVALSVGAVVERNFRVMHGKVSYIYHRRENLYRELYYDHNDLIAVRSALFEGVPEPFEAMRYHSLVVVPESEDRADKSFRVLAYTKEMEIMAIVVMRSMDTSPIIGVQFHPESIYTPEGKKILKNFLRIK